MDIRGLEPKHYAILGAFFTSLAVQVAGLQHGWGDALTPLFVAGIFTQVGVLLGALYAGAPGATGEKVDRRNIEKLPEVDLEKITPLSEDRRSKLPVWVMAAVLPMALLIGGCAPKAIGGRSTANLTTAGGGVQALHGIQAVKYLDIVRDLAVDGDKIGKVKTSTAAIVVKWHRAAIKTIDDSPNGWKRDVLTGIDQLSTAIPPDEQALFAPYILSAKTIIQAVIQ